MACNCGRNRAARTGTATASVLPGTYRVIVNEKQVYESSNPVAAETVAARFAGASILKPGESAQ